MFMTPAKPAGASVASPLVRASSSGAKRSAATCATPRDEAVLLRQLSSVMKEHMDTVTKAASRCVRARASSRGAGSRLSRSLAPVLIPPARLGCSSERERETAAAAALAELNTLRAELVGGGENMRPEQVRRAPLPPPPSVVGTPRRHVLAFLTFAASAPSQQPVCGWPENLSLRLDFFKLYENLSAMVQAPPPAAIKSALQSWAEGSLAAVSGIQQALMDAAPLGGKRAPAYAPASPATPVAAAAPAVVELSLPSPVAAAAPVAEAAVEAVTARSGERVKRRGAPGWLRAAGAALLAAAAVAAALQQQQRAAKPAAAKPEAAAEPAAAAAELPTAAPPPGPPPLLGQA
jgi:hypothetical protein